MNQELNLKLEDFFKELDNSNLIKNIKIYKNKVLNNKELVNKIEKIKALDKYSKEYQNLKLEIYKYDDYKNYIELENQLNFLILEITKKLKVLVRGNYENN